MRVREIMTEPVESVAATMPIVQTAAEMRGRRIHHLVVKDGAKMVGLLSARDVPAPAATGARYERS